MSEVVEIDKVLEKLNENNYDLNVLTPEELGNLQNNAPAIIDAISKLGKVGSEAQDKVYKTIDKAIEIFSEQLNDPSLSEEARDKLNDRIERMVDKAFQKDTEFKKLLLGMVYVGIGGGVLVLAGKNPEIRKSALNLLTKGKPS
ncbi:hypothetical protein SAMN05421736_12018 [Evansella caseinilytica]|uniref:Uncharacterized protein n=1 Tax=Evansella caseinilytica TaxID=1503961 RepID=A0A1H3UD88_9BACI|nr:hypothetical protein [Evansella caseinilytica]SDZ59815.1 hypothetical protein SAMN05421736_12018 [Evansella caseinilytica]